MEAFGRFILLRRLAEGGMGELFLAQQAGIAGFAKQLVVKRIKPSLAGDRAFVEMFLHEARVAALIDHPNVVHIHELGRVDDRYFIAMEYVPGRSLASVLEELAAPLELTTAVYIMLNLCEGLAYAHEAANLDGTPLGLVHRDISPPNVLLGYSGSVKLSDFGIAKVRHTQQTAAGMLKGKFAYLSPEQARGEELDTRSDIYALGLLLFEMTTGKRANPGPTDTGMVFAAARGEVLDPRVIDDDYPEALRRIFLKATALDAADRYAKVKDLEEELLAFQLERRLITTAGHIGEWLRQLPGSKAEPAAEPLKLDELDPAPEEDDQTGPPWTGALAAPPRVSADTRPKAAYAATVQVPNPGAVELDLAQESPSWHPRGSMERVGPFRREGHGLTIMLIVTGLAVACGAAYLLLRGSWRHDSTSRLGVTALTQVDGRTGHRRFDAGAAAPSGTAAPKLDGPRRGAAARPDARVRRAAADIRRAPVPALPPTRVPDLRPARPADGSRGANVVKPAPQTPPADARVYWTERGPVLP